MLVGFNLQNGRPTRIRTAALIEPRTCSEEMGGVISTATEDEWAISTFPTTSTL